jgi:multidrug efflux pump subunit AcrA (membrane-fusion protein)
MSMNRRAVIINSVLGLALVGVGVATAVSLTSANSTRQPVGQTVPVSRGTVTATVTATGNVQTRTSIGVSLKGSGGTVTKIYVKQGQRVAKGQRLLRIADTSARQSLKSAEANLASAEANMKTTTQGPSTEDQQLNDTSVQSAQTSLDNAETALTHAEQTYTLDKRQQDELVSDASNALAAAKKQKREDQQDLADAKHAMAAAKRAGNASEVSTQQSKINTLQNTLRTDQSSINSAESSLSQAKQTRAKTLLSDRQAIETQAGQVDSAKKTLASEKAQRASNEQGPRKGAVESAQAQIDSAKVSVREAQQTLANTVLRAPVAGTVSKIAAKVGESSGAAAASTTSSSASGAGANSSPSASAGSAAGGGSATTGGGSAALVTLVDLLHKEVVASVAEADVVKVKPGQSSSVLFPASNRTLPGVVTEIDTDSTVVNNVVQYDVTVDLTSAASSIKLGQTASVTITTATHQNVLYVPTSAITVSGDRATVIRRTSGVDSVVEVQPGLVGANGTEIVRGLQTGDRVVLPTGSGSGTFTFPGGGATAGPSSSSSTRPR